jgi:hypothetical protein
VVAVSSLVPGDRELHYSDGSHRWMCPWLNASEAYLGACLVEATGDLPHALAGELHRRFVGWLRPSRGR